MTTQGSANTVDNGYVGAYRSKNDTDRAAPPGCSHYKQRGLQHENH